MREINEKRFSGRILSSAAVEGQRLEPGREDLTGSILQ